ncbi:MAG: 50S ribosomal protein L30 [Methanobrevibacter wolinii]|uniref:50S ribosomal protein L30 n=1 Tax=Methanobrevibacter wolinii TaxID=190977 RepID=UPI0005B2C7B4|nr:50S ribosomal protein L30 [Methanobrevibacter wolinii]MDD5959360.1 50S ribosomal protein L30 [Methanobrevibacter wolinii]
MFLVIRIRGTTGVKRGIADTLDMLRLNRISHAVLVDETDSYKGMLQKGKDYITWGEVNAETLAKIIAKRGRLVGDAHVTDEYLKENTDYKSIEELANALIKGEIKAQDVGMKPVFRFHPPRKGYKGIRKPVTEGGSLGYRGEDINNLAIKMA